MNMRDCIKLEMLVETINDLFSTYSDADVNSEHKDYLDFFEVYRHDLSNSLDNFLDEIWKLQVKFKIRG